MGGSKEAGVRGVTSWSGLASAQFSSSAGYSLRGMKFPSGSKSSIGVTCFQRSDDVMEVAADANSSYKHGGEPPLQQIDSMTAQPTTIYGGSMGS